MIKVKRTAACPCGSGRQFKRCHRKAWRTVQAQQERKARLQEPGRSIRREEQKKQRQEKPQW